VRELVAAERQLMTAMQQLGFGRFECIPIRHGTPILDPWPTTIRYLKFGAQTVVGDFGNEYQLKHQAVDFLGCLRRIEFGEIRLLEFRHGLPFSAEIEIAGA
jgi:hypothetical protein